MVNLIKKFIFILLIFCSNLATAQKQVVVVLSEAQKLELQNNKTYTTGNYLNEFAIPLMALIDAGFEPVFYTPTGKIPNLDSDSIDIKYFNNDQKIFERAKNIFKAIGKESKLNSLIDIDKLDLSKVAVIFVPGGHAPMIDLSVNNDLGKLLRNAHSKKITTALICHGPIALLSAMDKPQEFVNLMKTGKIKEANKLTTLWPYKNYSMTIFTNGEEKVAEKEKLKELMTFYPQDALTAAGGKVVAAKLWSSNVVQDRELITAQNPNSVDEFAKKILLKIKK